MIQKIFTWKTSIHAPISKVFQWHSRDGAIQRLTPPWAPLHLVSRKGKGIDKGVEVRFRIKIFGIPMFWEAKHVDFKENELFRDRQTKGPFAFWEHSHLFESQAEDVTVMQDQVRFSLPLGVLSLPFYGYAQKELARMFSYRHEVLKYDVENRVGRGPKQRILISGASGTIGKALVPFLRTLGHEVIRLARDVNDASDDVLFWDPYKGVLDMAAAGPIDAVINLNGVDISRGRWTEKKRAVIMDSRQTPTRLLAEKMAGLANPPATFLSASAIGFYGQGGDTKLSEASGVGQSFISRVCEAWEAASLTAKEAGIRTVHLRTGVVLTPAGGALQRMAGPFAFGLGTRLSHGRQYMSWISMEDMLGSIVHLLENKAVEGPVNLTAPEPVTNAEFTRTLARVLSRPAPFVLPKPFILALWGDMGKETLLASARVMPQELLDSGYRFVHTRLEPALRHLLGK